jgi:uncharacterized repeat protein (TIGR01451 family)
MRFPIHLIVQRGQNSRLRSGVGSRESRKRNRRLQVEGLESRCLLSATINEFPVPTSDSNPTDIVTGPDGNLWFTESLGNKIGEINPTSHAIVEFPVPTAGSEPNGITAGPDGNLWFTEFDGNKIGQINPTTHAIAEFAVPTSLAEPREIAPGPDGNLWFTEELSNKIGQINPVTHAIVEFTIPTTDSSPEAITSGLDGNLWFTEGTGNKIGQINPTTHAITEFPVPTSGSLPLGITVGPDGKLWFTEENGNKVGQIDPATHAVTEFAVPTASSLPNHITAGSDGNLWFTERGVRQIGTISPTTHAVAEFSTPTSGSSPDGITAGPDGNVWFTELGGKIGQAVPSAPSGAPDLALSGSAPSAVKLGGSVTDTLTVSNDGTAIATGVALTDTLPAGARFVSATGGVTPINGILHFNIGNLVNGNKVSFSVSFIPTVAGMLSNQATASMNQTDPTSADNSVTQITTVAPVGADGPTVISMQRFGFHAQPTTLVLTFDTQLDPQHAQNVANYQIVALGGSRHTVRIKSAVYNSATKTVTLSPVDRLNLHERFRLTVVGTEPSGVTDTLGNLLDGLANGEPGSNLAMILTGKDLVLPTAARRNG